MAHTKGTKTGGERRFWHDETKGKKLLCWQDDPEDRPKCANYHALPELLGICKTLLPIVDDKARRGACIHDSTPGWTWEQLTELLKDAITKAAPGGGVGEG